MDVLIATDTHEAAAAERIVEHHAAMTGALLALVEDVISAAARGRTDEFRAARTSLVDWCRDELLPHARAEEGALYPLATSVPEARLLVAAMVDEHATIAALVDEVSIASEPTRAASTARALLAVFDLHVAKENERLVPLVASAPGVSLAGALDGMHAALADAAPADATRTESGSDAAPVRDGCGCGGHDEPGLPELDVQTIPHAIRHATIFGALDALAPGAGLVIAATHDPVPLIAQLGQRSPGLFAVDYLERGPQQWRVRFLRS